MRESQHPFPTLSPADAGAAPATNSGQANPAGAKPADEDAADVTYIKSPMVGDFLSFAVTGEQAVRRKRDQGRRDKSGLHHRGDEDHERDSSGAKGTVIEVLVENGQPVEYGQKLFRLKKA